DVQEDDAGAGGEGDADDEADADDPADRLLAGEAQFVHHRGDDDLQDGDEGGEAGQHQGQEEQGAEEPVQERELVDDLREHDEGETDAGGGHLADVRAGDAGHEADGGEDADGGQEFEAAVGEGHDEPAVVHVRLLVQVAAVRHHDGEGDGQAEEHLPVGGHPHFVPFGVAAARENFRELRREQVVQAGSRVVQRDGADDEQDHDHDENGHEKFVGPFNPLLHAVEQDVERGGPHDDKRQENVPLD